MYTHWFFQKIVGFSQPTAACPPLALKSTAREVHSQLLKRWSGGKSSGRINIFFTNNDKAFIRKHTTRKPDGVAVCIFCVYF